MLGKVLIANRGEIACRIMRTAERMGIATVAVYSDADAGALHVRQAGEAVHIGPSPAPESYLSIARIIAAAKATGADAIHPGYGFLSENADFAAAVVEAGLVFVGPTAAAMRALGGKAEAKEIAIKAGVPVVPGYQGARQDARTLSREAAKIGYPVMIKAVAGGGGRGMRLVEREGELAELLESARREAEQAFGNPAVLIEKVVVAPRHIEVQVFGDSHGNVVHLYERDCSLQRRHQKVIEEAPAPGMSAALRAKMCEAAVGLARAVGYEGAGTVEFLVEGGSLGPDARWYFIEMNTRLQVEHPVTEAITGLDLVEWQFRVAAGEALPLAQDAIAMSGHAIEVRLCAEDPAQGFLPSTGRIFHFAAPDDVDDLRIETGVEAGSEVSPFYDSMIAKLIVVRPTRAEALQSLRAATLGTAVVGPRTNQGFLGALLADKAVRAGKMDTGLIGRDLERFATQPRPAIALRAGISTWLAHLADDARELGTDRDAMPWRARDAFQLGAARRQSIDLLVDGRPETIDVAWETGGPEVHLRGSVPESGDLQFRYFEHRPEAGHLLVIADGVQIALAKPVYDASELDNGDASGAVRVPINGRLAKIFVEAGQTIEKGARVAVIEAMKMEHVVHAGTAGTVEKVALAEGAQVTLGALIATIAAG